MRSNWYLAAIPMAMLGVVGCGDDDDEGASGYCDAVEANLDGFSNDTDPATALAAFQEVEASVPEELDDAFATIVSFSETIVEAGDDPAAQEAALEGVDLDELDAAGTTIEEFTLEECDIVLDEDSDGESTDGEDVDDAETEDVDDAETEG